MPQTFRVQDTTWTPKSTDRDDWIGQTVTLKWGLTKSSNNISAYLMKQYGPHAMTDMMRKMGVGSYIDETYSLCVGSADLNVYEMVAAYNTFPSKGVFVEPIFVTRIEDANGKPDLSRLKMLMLKNRLDQWKKEVRLMAIRPLIYINYRSN